MEQSIFHNLQPDELKKIIQDSLAEVLEVHLTNTNPPQPAKDDQLIKLAEVAKLLNVSSVTVHTWKRKGLIPYYRISNKIFFKKNEVLNALKKAKSII